VFAVVDKRFKSLTVVRILMSRNEKVLLEFNLANPMWGRLSANPSEYKKTISETEEDFAHLDFRLKGLRCKVFYIPSKLPQGEKIPETIYVVGEKDVLEILVDELRSEEGKSKYPYGLYRTSGVFAFAYI